MFIVRLEQFIRGRDTHTTTHTDRMRTVTRRIALIRSIAKHCEFPCHPALNRSTYAHLQLCAHSHTHIHTSFAQLTESEIENVPCRPQAKRLPLWLWLRAHLMHHQATGAWCRGRSECVPVTCSKSRLRCICCSFFTNKLDDPPPPCHISADTHVYYRT